MAVRVTPVADEYVAAQVEVMSPALQLIMPSDEVTVPDPLPETRSGYVSEPFILNAAETVVSPLMFSEQVPVPEHPPVPPQPENVYPPDAVAVRVIDALPVYVTEQTGDVIPSLQLMAPSELFTVPPMGVETERVKLLAPLCVTENVCPATVIVPLREVVDVFAATE